MKAASISEVVRDGERQLEEGRSSLDEPTLMVFLRNEFKAVL
jgi:hypothetical protein